jgi:hypothetical protein
MLKLGTLRWKGRCKKHPKYDPADGEGAIRGGCETCHRLLQIHLTHRRLVAMMRDFGPVREKRGGPAPADKRQGNLFE